MSERATSYLVAEPLKDKMSLRTEVKFSLKLYGEVATPCSLSALGYRSKPTSEHCDRLDLQQGGTDTAAPRWDLCRQQQNGSSIFKASGLKIHQKGKPNFVVFRGYYPDGSYVSSSAYTLCASSTVSEKGHPTKVRTPPHTPLTIPDVGQPRRY
jgi:hypothetical protein